MRLIALICLLALSIGAVEKPPIVAATEWGSKPQPIDDSRKHTPQWITIHHAGEMWLAKKSPEQYVRDMQAWGQREKHWPDLPYHFLIAPDGRIFEGRPLIYEPDTNTKYQLAGNKTFVLTYSQVPTQNYASSALCAQALCEAIGVPMENVMPGSIPATLDPQYPLQTRADVRGFHVWGYGGSDAQAHLTHARHIADVWKALDAAGMP